MKSKIWVKEDYELPELTYQEGEEFKGGFTLLESPAERRIYEVDTSEEILNSIKSQPDKYEVFEIA